MAQLFSTCIDHNKKCRKPYFFSQKAKELQCTPAFPSKSTVLKFNRCDLYRQHFKRKALETLHNTLVLQKNKRVWNIQPLWPHQTPLKSKGKSLNIYALCQEKCCYEKYSQSPPYEPSIPLNTSNPKLKLSYEDHRMDPRPRLSSSSVFHHSNKCHYNRTIKTPRSYTSTSQNTV